MHPYLLNVKKNAIVFPGFDFSTTFQYLTFQFCTSFLASAYPNDCNTGSINKFCTQSSLYASCDISFNLKSIEDKIRISRHSNRVMTVWTVKKTRYWHYRNEKNLEKFLCKLHIIHAAETSRFMIVNMNLILRRFFNTMDSNLHILI